MTRAKGDNPLMLGKNPNGSVRLLADAMRSVFMTSFKQGVRPQPMEENEENTQMDDSALASIDLSDLLKGVPRGAWVAISSDNERVIAFGSDIRAVIAESKKKGEDDPLITRAPESVSTLML